VTSPKSSARILGKAIQVDKKTVNGFLYKHSKDMKLFVKEGLTPPLWSIASGIPLNGEIEKAEGMQHLNLRYGSNRADPYWYKIENGAPPSNTDFLEK
jgi:hypothetical protein